LIVPNLIIWYLVLTLEIYIISFREWLNPCLFFSFKLHVVAGNGQKILPGKDGYIGGKAKKKKKKKEEKEKRKEKEREKKKKKKNKKMEKVKGKEECK